MAMQDRRHSPFRIIDERTAHVLNPKKGLIDSARSEDGGVRRGDIVN